MLLYGPQAKKTAGRAPLSQALIHNMTDAKYYRPWWRAQSSVVGQLLVM